MSTLTIKTENNEVLEAVKNLLKTFQGKFELEEDDPYDPEFVAMIKESERQADQGKTVKLEPSMNLWDLANSR